MKKLAHRSEEKELMDDLDCTGEMLNQTLQELRIINKWLGGNHVTTSGLALVMRERPQLSYTIADVGCGGGDMISVMAKWAKRNHRGKQISFIGIDANKNIIDLAKDKLVDLEQVKWRVQNVFDPQFSEEMVDIATCTLFAHHFTEDELVGLLKGLRKKSRLGVIINDLHRHPIAYYSIKILTGLFSKSPMVKNDAPLSVMRSFSRKDWINVLHRAGCTDYQITWHWAFRWRVSLLF